MLRLVQASIRGGLLAAVLLGVGGCQTFEVGPEIHELFEDDADACRAAGLGDEGGCRRFDLDNPGLVASADPVPILLTFGYDAPRRDLEQVHLRLEQPGVSPTDRICVFDADPTRISGDAPLSCVTATLAGGVALPQDAEHGIIAIDLDVTLSTPGPHALSVWLRDSLDLASPTLRWQFVVAADPEG